MSKDEKQVLIANKFHHDRGLKFCSHKNKAYYTFETKNGKKAFLGKDYIELFLLGNGDVELHIESWWYTKLSSDKKDFFGTHMT